ncbi:MAG: hypothetical protein JWO19_994 [Bryobacterales bacterium]|nr:hypothetical protein [Bryobacterales bacterium]
MSRSHLVQSVFVMQTTEDCLAFKNIAAVHRRCLPLALALASLVFRTPIAVTALSKSFEKNAISVMDQKAVRMFLRQRLT